MPTQLGTSQAVHCRRRKQAGRLPPVEPSKVQSPSGIVAQDDQAGRGRSVPSGPPQRSLQLALMHAWHGPLAAARQATAIHKHPPMSSSSCSMIMISCATVLLTASSSSMVARGCRLLSQRWRERRSWLNRSPMMSFLFISSCSSNTALTCGSLGSRLCSWCRQHTQAVLPVQQTLQRHDSHTALSCGSLRTGCTYTFRQLYMPVGLYAHLPLQQLKEMLLLQPALAGQAEKCWADRANESFCPGIQPSFKPAAAGNMKTTADQSSSRLLLASQACV